MFQSASKTGTAPPSTDIPPTGTTPNNDKSLPNKPTTPSGLDSSSSLSSWIIHQVTAPTATLPTTSAYARTQSALTTETSIGTTNETLPTQRIHRPRLSPSLEQNKMLATRRSILTGRTTTAFVPCTESQYQVFKAGADPTLVMPACSADHLEFLVTGITPGEWPTALASGEV